MAEPTPRHTIEEAARRAKLPRACYLVLTALTARLGQNDAAWPSVATLAEDCALSRRSVQLALRRLEVAGWLASTTRKGTSTRYQIEVGQAIAGEVRPDHWRPRKPWGAQQVAPVQHVAHAQHVAQGGAQHVAGGVRNMLHPNPPMNPQERTDQDQHAHEPEPAPVEAAAPAPLPVQPVPRLPIPSRPPATPPPAPPGACQNDRRQGRPNLAALAKPREPDVPIPMPEEVPVYELPDLLRPGESVALPGTLDELFADARGMGRPIIAALRDAGIATTRELFERLPVESVAFTRGLSGARGNELLQHLGDRWCVFLRSKDDIDAINAKTVYSADRRRRAQQEARAGLRIVGGEA